jgi:vancomycin resistance protein YoaR
VEVEPAALPPEHTVEDAQVLADRANDLTADPLVLQAGGTTAEAPSDLLRTWFQAAATSNELVLSVDAEKVLADLPGLFPDVGEKPKDARFVIEGGAVSVVRGEQGTACCGEESPQLVLDAVTNPGSPPPDLPLKTVDPEITAERAQGLGVKEPIGEFTTRHACCQSRVTNIHRIADIVRGVVILPGERFSVNEFVGRRTTANGFVTGGVIQNGVFEESVGGGISQFATTTFNAAFFAGLEIPEYQSHSIYISRYPYGREATLSFPKPDLVLENNTPYGVVLWPTYTETSITMTLWSTKWVSGEQTGQTESPAGNCTRVTTERTRTYLEDGHTEVDHVFATYRPGEGVDC